MTATLEPPKVPLSRRVFRKSLFMGVAAMALGIVYRQALPWSWGYFATMAAVGVVSIATQRRGWLAQGSIGPGLLLASTAVILQRFFYRELPDTWPRNAVVLSVLVSGLAAGFLVGLAVPESERVRRLSTTLTK